MNITKTLFFTAALCVSAVTLIGCAQKAEQPQTEQFQAPDSSAAYNNYKQQIDGLSQVGVTVTSEEYPIATADTARFNATVADLEQRIKADSTIEGTETSGQKAELLKFVKDSASKNAPFFRVAEMNKQTESNLKTYMTATGVASLKEAKVQQAVIKRKGTDAWLKLYETNDDGAFIQKVTEMFPG